MKTTIFFLLRSFLIAALLTGCAKEDPDNPGNPDNPGEVLEELDVTGEAVMTVNIENDLGEDSAEGSPKLIDNDTLTKFLVYDIQEGLEITFRYEEPVQVAA